MTQQLLARFQFRPESSAYYSWDGNEFVEMQFDEVEEVIDLCNAFQDDLLDCTVQINNKIISLAEMPRL